MYNISLYWRKLARVFVDVSHFHPSQIFVGKVRSLPLEGR
jgi:hypothetical protein